MRKILIPVICILISFSFSGKNSSIQESFNCGPSILLQNSAGYTVTKVEVRHVGLGLIYTYNNPGFPFYYNNVGGWLKITYWFSSAQTGSIQWTGNGDCQFNGFFSSGATFVNVFADCTDYWVDISTDPWANCP